MILTVTMNPSVDISYTLSELKIDDVNRVDQVTKTAGGKGLNVTRVAAALGKEVLATGVLGGTLGTFMLNQLEEQKIAHRFFQINRESRNCIAILHNGKQTEILESGPTITAAEAGGFLEHFEKLLKEYSISVLTISGSLPKGLTADMYKQMIKLANRQGIPVILDTSGATLAEVLADPTLKLAAIKPNLDEIRAIENQTISKNPVEWEALLQTSRYQHVERVIVTLGADGAYARIKDQFYQVQIPKIDVVNPVGSGDATVAGIAIGIEQGMPAEKLLKTAMTTGMLNTMEKTTGYVNPDYFDVYFEQVTVESK